MYEQYLTLLKQIISFKSISTDPAFKDELTKTVEWLKNLFTKHNFSVEVWQKNQTNPVIFAQYTSDPTAETILVYGHYDVQPANQADGWYTNPFEVLEKDNRLYARGIVDNKGQVMIHIATVISLLQENKLKYNVKFLIEGNEETANDDLPGLIAENKLKLACDYVVVSDGEIVEKHPVLEKSLRGGLNCTLKFKTANNNVHSGLFGGAIPNAAHELAKFIAQLYDEKNQITIPGFYDNVDPITPQDTKNNQMTSKLSEKVLHELVIKQLATETNLDFYSQIGMRPTIQVTGLKSGYIDDGYSNIVPCEATAKINMRFVCSQSHEYAFTAFKNFVTQNTPNYITWSLEQTSGWDPIKIDTSSPKFQEVATLLTECFDQEVLIKPVGGSIPIVMDFKQILGKDTLLVSLGNEDCNMHGVNENFDKDILLKGLNFGYKFFSR